MVAEDDTEVPRPLDQVPDREPRRGRSGSPARALLNGLALFVALLAVTLFGRASDLTNFLQRTIGDLRSGVLTHGVGNDLLLVDIDARSLASLGVWPWPRSLHGRLVQESSRLGAARVAFDIDFSTHSPKAEEDEAFAAALAASKAEILLAAFVQSAGGASGEHIVSMPIAALSAHGWPAAVNARPDRDGAVRRFPFAITDGKEEIASLPALLSGRSGQGDFGIDYAIDDRGFPHVSYVDLLEGRVDREHVAGRTLIVGATAVELHDFFPAPRGGVVFGTSILALATETLRQNRETSPYELPPLLEILGVGLLSLLLLRRLGPKAALVTTVGIGLALEVAALAVRETMGSDPATAGIHLLLVTAAAARIQQEFGFSRLLLWIRGLEVRNRDVMIDRLVDEGFDAIVVLDDHDVVVRINRAARDLLGLELGSSVDGLSPVLGEAIRRVRSRDPHATRRVDVQFEHVTDGETRILEAGLSAFTIQRAGETANTPTSGVYVCTTLRDVTERERAQVKIRQLALTNQVTGRPNRNALDAWLNTGGAEAGYLIVLGLDRFRRFNELLGYRNADAILSEVARRLDDAGLGRVAHIGTDQFAVLVDGDGEEAMATARHLLEVIGHPMAVADHRISVTPCAGIALGEPNLKPSELFGRAERAMRDAKQRGAGSISCFDIEMETQRLKRLAVEFGFQRALDEGEFHTVYQPQVSLTTGRIVGVEALVRWRHPTEGEISPALFVPIAEETGLIHKLGTWVLNRACGDAVLWPKPITVAVNVSPLQLQTGDLAASVLTALETSGLAVERLQLELTESSFVGEGSEMRAEFDLLRERGVSFALDDFGTGYSSMSHLARFPISKIKIDRSFVVGLPNDETSLAILRSIMALAEGIGAHTIAEGIEDEVQAAVLRDLGCEEGQGFLYSRGIGNDELRALLMRDAD